MRRVLASSLLACLTITIACASLREQSLDVVASLVGHNLCSEIFVSGLAPDRAYAESLAPRPGMGLVNWAVRYEVDVQQGEVRTRIGGSASRTIHRPGLGCLVVHGDVPGAAATAPAVPAPRLAEIAGPALVDPDDPVLRAALDRAFEEPAGSPQRFTRAVVVVHDGRVVAERYASGIGIDTPLLGYSATKSVTSALVGILVRDGRLAADEPAPIAEWSDRADPRHAITIDHLLRMTSGLALDESGMPWSPVARMLYRERDMAGYAASAEPDGPPGQVWRYTSGNTLLLSAIVRDAVGGRLEDVLRFAREELFAPLGMRSVVLELDAVGTPVGSTYLLASARDWARFGLLYLDDGKIGDRRILPEGWIERSTTPTLDTGYGAGFWTNRVPGRIPWSPVSWGIPGAPPDTFFARGLLGQYVVVVPSQRLVVVRLGATHGSDGDIEGISRLVADVIGALDSPRR